MRCQKNHSRLGAIALAATLLAAPTVGAQTAIFKRGDVNSDAALDISDSIVTLRYLFGGGVRGVRLPCLDAADINDDGTIDVADAVASLFTLFAGAPEPPAPGLRCGADPTDDALGCEVYLPCGHVGEPTALAALKTAESCDQVLDQLRDRLIETMEKTLDENLQQALALVGGAGCPIWDDWFLADFDGAVPLAGAEVGDTSGGAAGESAEEFSETNNQVDGVDEADFIKNDGRYIYILADGKFQIVDAWPAPQAHRIASVDLAGTPKKLFVYGDRAVVYSSLDFIVRETIRPWADWIDVIDPGECTYGYDCEFNGDGRRLQVSVFDISDRARPELKREVEFSGSYLNSRRIGERVYTVVTFGEVILPAISYWPEKLENLWDFCWPAEFPFSEEDVRAMFETLRMKNLEVIETASLADFLPSTKVTNYDTDPPQTIEGLLQNCQDFYLSQSGDGQSLLSLVSFAVDAPDDMQTTTIIGKPGAVYASEDSLYVATRHYGWEADVWYFSSRELIPEATTIHKFTLESGGGTAYVGSGAVKGRILNQFSMDEHSGYLRIATTTGRVPSPTVHSTVSVLDEQAGGLVVLGEVDNIAPTEDIRSVRFFGHIGYIVTFKKTDPLFVIDLADPTRPVIRGELKIPGFSTYMHMLDEGHLLTIGYDADDQGSFAWFTGILLQVIDVSDMDNPALLYREVIGTRGSTSDAATNHLAFNFFRSRGLLGLPMVICEGEEGGGRYGTEMTFSGLMVYRVGLDSGFEFLGGIPHSQEDASVNCGNWWTRSNSQVKRSVFMDDYVYSVALDKINISHIELLEEPVASVSLTE